MCEDSSETLVGSIIAGVFGALLGIFGFFKLDVIINSLAVIVGCLLFAMTTMECVENDEDSQKLYIMILVMSFVANLIRLKSILHGYVLSKENLWEWLKDQKVWISSSKTGLLLMVPLQTNNHILIHHFKKGIQKLKKIHENRFLKGLIGVVLLVSLSITYGIQMAKTVPHVTQAHKLVKYSQYSCTVEGNSLFCAGKDCFIIYQVSLKPMDLLTFFFFR